MGVCIFVSSWVPVDMFHAHALVFSARMSVCSTPTWFLPCRWDFGCFFFHACECMECECTCIHHEPTQGILQTKVFILQLDEKRKKKQLAKKWKEFSSKFYVFFAFAVSSSFASLCVCIWSVFPQFIFRQNFLSRFAFISSNCCNNFFPWFESLLISPTVWIHRSILEVIPLRVSHSAPPPSFDHSSSSMLSFQHPPLNSNDHKPFCPNSLKPHLEPYNIFGCTASKILRPDLSSKTFE